jgi:hypothetical protein
MKKIRIAVLTMSLLLVIVTMFGQKLKSGDVKVLKGQTSINLQFDYSNMAVGKYESADEYVADRKADMNKKKPGSGDQWAESWVSDRDARFHPMFVKNLNEKLSDFGVMAKEGATDAKYTLIVHTTYVEPGYNVGITRKNAYVNIEVTLVETASKEKVLALIDMSKLQSINMMGYDYDTGGRIQSCYDRAGEYLGKFLGKNAYK